MPEDEQKMADAVAAATGSGLRTGILVPVRRGEHQPPYRASIFSLSPDHVVPDAVLFVDDPNDDAGLTQGELYANTFRLTPAEARLAVHLASGDSLITAADVLGVTHNTVRAHLRSIFAKTDVHRQAELVRLLQNSRSLRVSLS